MSTEQRIINKVEECRDEIIRFVQSVVQIPSVTEHEEEIAHAFVKQMKEYGLEAELVEPEPHRPNAVGRLRGEMPGKTLIFNGHMDICPPGPEEEWEFPPYSGEIKDGMLYGRGTVDMKSGTCGGTLACWIIKQLGIPLKGDVVLTCVCDEEYGSILGSQYLAKNGYMKGDFVINCEATNLQTIDIVHKGVLRCAIAFYGKTIHGARPWLGINAIDKAVDFLVRMRELEKELWTRTHPLLKPATINVGTNHGGSAQNMIPGKCVIELNRRLVPGETHEKAIQDIRDILDEMAAKDPDFKAELLLDEYSCSPILDIPADAPPVVAIRKAHKLVHGKELPLGGKDAGTDACAITAITGLPCPVYGPGDYIRYSLGPNEHIPVQDIVDAVKVYALAIYYLLGAECN